MSKLAVIDYSATGHGTAMANRVASAAEAAGAEARVRHIAETRDPQSFAQNPAWTANHEATKDLPAASGEDIVWADAIMLPFRLGERVNGPPARPPGVPRRRRRCRSGFALLGPAIDRCARRLQMGMGVGRGGREPWAAVVGGAIEFPELPQVR